MLEFCLHKQGMIIPKWSETVQNKETELKKS